MYEYIQGKIADLNPTRVVIDVHGVGYVMDISLESYAKLEGKDDAKLFTQLIVREDSQRLFGFAEVAERDLFNQLISVSGIGPNTARIVLSSMGHEGARAAILTGDVPAFKSVKGVGPKTAQRIILDLKDKVLKTSEEAPILTQSSNNTLKLEALSALVALGFKRATVEKAISALDKGENAPETVEEMIKSALKKLS